jgi:hypothetical protein
MVDPTQSVDGPEIGPGEGCTAILMLVLHPVGNVYIIVTVPPDTPVTIPEEDPTVAIVVLLLLHTPPGGRQVKVIVLPAHRLVGPVIGPGFGLTVTVITDIQPVESI